MPAHIPAPSAHMIGLIQRSEVSLVLMLGTFLLASCQRGCLLVLLLRRIPLMRNRSLKQRCIEFIDISSQDQGILANFCSLSSVYPCSILVVPSAVYSSRLRLIRPIHCSACLILFFLCSASLSQSRAACLARWCLRYCTHRRSQAACSCHAHRPANLKMPLPWTATARDSERADDPNGEQDYDRHFFEIPRACISSFLCQVGVVFNEVVSSGVHRRILRMLCTGTTSKYTGTEIFISRNGSVVPQRSAVNPQP